MTVMNEPPFSEDALANATQEEIMSALFANLIIQQTNMAMMMMGKMAHPETGQAYKDLESAKLFIDQMEMLEVKTKGNLDKREQHLLKQSLTAVRLAFVEALEGQGESAPASEAATPSARAAEPPAGQKEPSRPAPATAAPSTPSADDSESRKKFSKKY
jgi:hypothetical protein